MNRRERLAWAAGLVDGEGCFTTHGSRNGLLRIGFTMVQKDIEVLDDFMGTVRVGLIRSNHKGTNSMLNRFEADGHVRVQHIASSLWFAMGSVKRDQAHRVLTAWYKSRGYK